PRQCREDWKLNYAGQKFQIPKPKLQGNSNHQAPKTARPVWMFEYWSLELLWGLVLGTWGFRSSVLDYPSAAESSCFANCAASGSSGRFCFWPASKWNG